MLIYKIVNKNNGKVYIGQTVQTINNRWYGHMHDSFIDKRGSKFHTALREEGREAFDISIIEDGITDYDTLNSRGYNTMDGGNTYPFCDKGVCEKLKGRHLSEEHKKRISLAQKGRINPSGKEHARSKPIIQIDCLGSIINSFESMGIAAIYMGNRNKQGLISKACNGKRKTAYGFQWEYQNKGDLNV